MTSIIFLAIGAIISVLMIFCSAPVYELAYIAPGYSDQMWNNDVYFTSALIMVLSAWIFAAIYYYVINSVHFDRWFHWLLPLVINAVVAPISVFYYNDAVFRSLGLAYRHEITHFAVINVFFALAFFVLASYSMRPWSSNCRHTPFPQ